VVTLDARPMAPSAKPSPVAEAEPGSPKRWGDHATSSDPSGGAPTRLSEPSFEGRWSSTASGVLSWADAPRFCSALREDGFTDWRLPTKAELESLIDRSTRPPSDPDPAARLLLEPHRTQLGTQGYLFSGELVFEHPDHPYVMNLRNAHVFNG
jgi:hypothetical protein